MYQASEKIKAGQANAIGIVGLGKIVQLGHMPSYLAAGLNVVAAADKDGVAVASFRSRFATVPTVSDRVEDIFSNPAVSIVDIATPPYTHPELVKAALAAGKHVMCQKPLALTLAEASSVVDYAEQRGLRLAVNQNIRYSPANRFVASWLQEGRIGTPYLAVFEYLTLASTTTRDAPPCST